VIGGKTLNAFLESSKGEKRGRSAKGGKKKVIVGGIAPRGVTGKHNRRVRQSLLPKMVTGEKICAKKKRRKTGAHAQ